MSITSRLSPIFNDPKPANVKIESSPPQPASSAEMLRERCVADKVNETDLLNFLDGTFGLSVNKLEELDDESIAMIQDKWSDIVTGIKEVTQSE